MTHEDIARKLARKIFVEAGVTADSDMPTLINAVDALDTAMNATTDTAATQYPGTAVQNALLQYLQAADPNLSNQEAGIALAFWALDKVGLL